MRMKFIGSKSNMGGSGRPYKQYHEALNTGGDPVNDSFFFPTYTGLLTPEHRKNIGTAIWEFQWCISKTTKEIDSEDGKIGLVLGGKPIKLSEIAEDFGIDEKTVSRNLKRLEKYGYIQLIRAPYGFVIRVNKSKKFAVKRTDKNVHSHIERDRTKMSDQTEMSTPDWTKMSARPDKNVRSNKDIKDIKLNDDDDISLAGFEEYSSDERIEKIKTHFSKKAQKIWYSSEEDLAMIQLLEDGVPVETILEGINLAFKRFKPKHSRDQINSFRYCLSAIYELHEKPKQKERERQHETRSEVPKHSGSAGSHQRNTSLDARIREQQERRLKELEAKYGGA